MYRGCPAHAGKFGGPLYRVIRGTGDIHRGLYDLGGVLCLDYNDPNGVGFLGFRYHRPNRGPLRLGLGSVCQAYGSQSLHYRACPESRCRRAYRCAFYYLVWYQGSLTEFRHIHTWPGIASSGGRYPGFGSSAFRAASLCVCGLGKQRYCRPHHQPKFPGPALTGRRGFPGGCSGTGDSPRPIPRRGLGCGGFSCRLSRRSPDLQGRGLCPGRCGGTGLDSLSWGIPGFPPGGGDDAGRLGIRPSRTYWVGYARLGRTSCYGPLRRPCSPGLSALYPILRY